VLTRGTAASAVQNFPPLKPGAVCDLLEQVREKYIEEIRLVRAIRGRLVRNGLGQRITVEAANLAAKKAPSRSGMAAIPF